MLNYKEKTKFNIKLMYVFFILIVVFGLTGCVTKNNDLLSDNSNEDEAYLQYIKGEKIAIIDGEKTWISDNIPAQGAPYCIIDLNSDGKKELIINRYDSWPEVFCYDGENIIDAELGAYPTLSNVYFRNDGYAILEDKNHGGRFAYSVLKLNELKYEEVESFEYWFYDKNGDESYWAYPAGSDAPNEITDKEYEEKINNYINNIVELEYVNPY